MPRFKKLDQEFMYLFHEPLRLFTLKNNFFFFNAGIHFLQLIFFFCSHLESSRTLFTTFSNPIQLEFQQRSLWSDTSVVSHSWRATNMPFLKLFPQFMNFKTVLKLDTTHFTGKLLEKYRQNAITQERDLRKTKWVILLPLHGQVFSA